MNIKKILNDRYKAQRKLQTITKEIYRLKISQATMRRIIKETEQQLLKYKIQEIKKWT